MPVEDNYWHNVYDMYSSMCDIIHDSLDCLQSCTYHVSHRILYIMYAYISLPSDSCDSIFLLHIIHTITYVSCNYRIVYCTLRVSMTVAPFLASNMKHRLVCSRV